MIYSINELNSLSLHHWTQPLGPNHKAGKYIHDVHGAAILDACGGEGAEVMTDKNKKLALAKELGLEYKQITYGLKRLLKNRSLIKEKGKCG